MERSAPYFEAMGLPSRTVAEPWNLARCAREYLNRVAGHRTLQAMSSADRTQEQALADAFSQIASEYDSEIADRLYEWCLKYVVNDNTAVEMSIWRELFRRLCGIVGPDEYSCPPPLSDDAIRYICGIVRPDLHGVIMKGIRQQIHTTRALPKSEWENWLEIETRHLAGEGQNLSAVDMTLDLVEGIVANVRTCEARARLKSQLSPGQEADLLAWATRQATALGIPVKFIHDLDDQRPERQNPRD
jgi:hypothetical protein